MRHIKRLIPYYSPYKLQLIVGLILVVVGSGIASAIPWYLKRGIDGIRSGVPLSHSALLGLAIVVTALIAGICRFGMRHLLNGISRRIEYDLRNDLFKHLLSLDANYFSAIRTGDVMARLTNDLSAVRMAVGPAIMYLTNTIFGGLFALAFMTAISTQLTVIALLPMLAIPLLAVKLGKLIHMRFEAVQEHFSTLTTHAQENLSGVRIVRAYQQEEAEIQRFSDLNVEYIRRNLSLVRLWGILHPSFSFLVGIASVLVLGIGGSYVLQARISVGDLIAFSMYLGMLTWPLIALGWVINLFQRGDASMGRLAEILDSQPTIKTLSPFIPLPPAKNGRSIEFRNVSYTFPAHGDHETRWVLENVSFKLEAGDTLGVAGPTGSGKSVLIDLIARIYDPQKGEILIDGLPVKNIDVHELRREIGYVPQESILFSETIRSNLQYGINEGEDPESWRHATKVAQLDSAVADFPEGYDTMLGERGINLSGGQKQRASLARALARNPNILLLDDSLSAVDTHTEAAILEGLRQEVKGRTSVISSHRASALRGATRIIVLEDGKIVESGTHEDLLATEGRYFTLVRRQSLEEEIEGVT